MGGSPLNVTKLSHETHNRIQSTPRLEDVFPVIVEIPSGAKTVIRLCVSRANKFASGKTKKSKNDSHVSLVESDDDVDTSENQDNLDNPENDHEAEKDREANENVDDIQPDGNSDDNGNDQTYLRDASDGNEEGHQVNED
ncbi:unnamed protein product [Bemisia tabaci]|uniref:Uncharacterized protein n=1 Tax=Bemisia tabaci TaxID=7038 RepID=A0A9P0EYL1_BEMTA|nr:unnamed protein product [Bemisia tabaci]